MHCVLRVACRQMGFPDGADIFTGNATDADCSMTLHGVRCAVSESFFPGLSVESVLHFNVQSISNVYLRCMCRNCTEIGERVLQYEIHPIK